MIYSQPIIVTLVTSALPIIERGAVPLGLGLGLSPFATYVVVVLGNMLPVLPLLFFLRYISQWAIEHIPLAQRALTWVFDHVRSKEGKKMEAFGFGALVLLVAIPSPVTGIWTASVVAYLIKMPIKKAFFAILLGVLIATALLLAGTLGIIKLL